MGPPAMYRAVIGMICISPRAPTGETAVVSKFDSRRVRA